MHKSRWFDGCWLICCLLASSAWCLSTARQLSATFDEPLYLKRGLERWRTGSHAGLMKLGTMPLPIDWDTLPLYIYERWTGTPIDIVSDFPRALVCARAAALAFWWLLLIYGWLAGRSLAGPWGGRLAVAWLACEPNLLAHASLATTDIAVSACLLALTYHFRLGRDERWWQRIGVPGFWIAGALLAKASAMVFGPLCLIAVETERLLRRRQPHQPEAPARAVGWDQLALASAGPPRQVLKAATRDMFHIAAIGFLLTLVYTGSDWRPEPSFVDWAHKLPEGRTHDSMVWLSEHLCIFSNAAEGLVRQVKHNMRGHHGSYLLGRTYPHPLWYYFPTALAIKLTLPLLIAPLAVAIAARSKAVNWAGAAALTLFAFSLTCRVQIGIRLILPLVVFLIVGLAAAMIELIRQRSRMRPLWISGAIGALVWTGVASWQVWPEGLCYTNELWGGTPNGYLCLSDSNYDWGQGVHELAGWSASHQVPRLDVWYFGTDPAANIAPLRLLKLHDYPVGKPQDVPAFVQGRYLAVGTTLIYGTELGSPGHRCAVEYLRQRQPIARTSTFLIYDLSESAASMAQMSGSSRGAK